jgi:DNA helicase-2/ATP-dependent DNA helicase PcrA
LVLSRTDYNGTFTKLAKTEFEKRGVPVTDPDELLCLLAEPDNRRLLCALHLLVNPTDSLAWWTLVHLCKGLGASFVEHLSKESCSSNRTFGEAFQAAAGAGFEGVAAATRQRAISLWEEASAWLNTTSLHAEQAQADWGALILSDVDCGRLPPCSEGFRQLLLSLDGVMEEPQDMGRFLSQVEPLGKDLMLSHSEGVRFMTMIGSKGLTVTATILMGVDNDLIPRPGENLDEERRLLYVAMTRSKEHLFLTWARTRRGPAARAGRQNIGRRQPSDLLRGGSEESKDGPSYIQAL